MIFIGTNRIIEFTAAAAVATASAQAAQPAAVKATAWSNHAAEAAALMQRRQICVVVLPVTAWTAAGSSTSRPAHISLADCKQQSSNSSAVEDMENHT